MKVEDLRHEDLIPAAENPNAMSEAAIDALKVEIAERGFVQPVLVRPHPDEEGKYEIIDGEHRWKILGELGAETVPSVVDNVGDTDAEVRRLTMNRLRGKFVPIRLAHLLSDLAERLPESEIRSRMALDHSTLTNYLNLASFLDEPDPDAGGVPGPGGTKADDGKVDVVFVCTQEQSREVEKRLAKLTGDDPEREPAVLSRLARNWDG